MSTLVQRLLKDADSLESEAERAGMQPVDRQPDFFKPMPQPEMPGRLSHKYKLVPEDHLKHHAMISFATWDYDSTPENELKALMGPEYGGPGGIGVGSVEYFWSAKSKEDAQQKAKKFWDTFKGTHPIYVDSYSHCPRWEAEEGDEECLLPEHRELMFHHNKVSCRNPEKCKNHRHFGYGWSESE